MVLPAHVRRELESLAVAAYPEEGCGVLLGKPTPQGPSVVRVLACGNVAEDRRRAYLLEPLEYLAAERAASSCDLEVVGIWHSHPDGAPVPSETDRVQAWGGWSYVIAATSQAGVTGLRAWRLRQDVFTEEDIHP